MGDKKNINGNYGFYESMADWVKHGNNESEFEGYCRNRCSQLYGCRGYVINTKPYNSDAIEGCELLSRQENTKRICEPDTLRTSWLKTSCDDTWSTRAPFVYNINK